MYDNFIDPISDFSQNKVAVLFSTSIFILYYKRLIKKMLKFFIDCTLDEEKSVSDSLFLMLEFCFTKNSNFIFDIFIPSKIISFSGSIITALDDLIDGFSVKLVLPSISTHVKLYIIIFFFFGLHFYFFCYFLINYTKNVEVNSLIFNNLFTILYYTIGVAIYHTLFIFDRPNFGCSIQTENRANTIQNYGELIYHILYFIINVFRVYIIWPSLYTGFHFLLSIGKLYSAFRDFSFYLKMKNIKSELPDATIQDIERDDICIICRESMTVGTAKKLPCGHCFHTACLERWVNKNPACPTCSRDLRKIFNKKNNERNEKDNEIQVNDNDENDDNEPNDYDHFDDDDNYHFEDNIDPVDNDDEHDRHNNRNNNFF